MNRTKSVVSNTLERATPALTRRPLWQRTLAATLIVSLELAPLKASIDGILELRFGFNAAYAGGPIADPYAPVQFQPKLRQSSAGVPVVNITAPNAAGMSMNRYQQFNIDAAGLILNNSLVGGGTLLGGNVDGNANLNGHTASLIINEVNSGAFASQLNGSLEVFGAPAHVIIANPNGISCTGCAFVNTPRLTLTTGAVEFLSAPNGSLTAFANATALAFDVTSGHVTVGGIGIEGTTGRMDIIAQTMTIEAALRANLGSGTNSQINLIAGRNRVTEDANGNYVISANAAANSAEAIKAASPNQSSVQNGYAIDASALGAMTAGQIKVIATTEGLGVKSDGALAATAGNLTIDSSGQIRVGDAYAKQDVNLNARGDLNVAGKVVAAQNSALATGGALSVAGDVEAGQQLHVQAARDAAFSGSMLATQNAALNVSGNLTQVGQVSVGGNYSVNAGSIRATGDTVVDGAIDFNATGAIAFGNLATQQTFTLNAAGDVTGSGDTIALAGIDITSSNGNVTSLGSVATNGQLSVNTQGGALLAGGTTALGALNVRAVQGDAALTGQTHANGAVNLSAGRDVRIGGAMQANESARIEAGRDVSLGGEVQVAGDLSVNAGGSFGGDGNALVGGNVRVDSGAAATFGSMLGVLGNLELNAKTDVTLQRGMTVAGDARIAAREGALINNGDFIVGNNSNVTAGTDAALNGSVTVMGHSRITAGRALSTGGSLRVGADANLTGQTLLLAGQTEVGGVATLRATQGDANLQGDITATTLFIESSNQLNINGNLGVVLSAQLRADGDLSNTGNAIVGGDLLQQAGRDLTNGGVTLAFGNLSTSAGRDALFSGTLAAGANLELFAQRHANVSGAVQVAGNAALRAQDGDLATGGSISIARDASLSAGSALTTGGALDAGGNIDLRAGALATLGGTTSARGALTATANALHATGAVKTMGDAALTATGAGIVSDASIESNGNITLRAATDVRGAGTVAARGDVQVAAQAAIESDGNISAGGNATLEAQQSVRAGGVSAISDANVISRASDVTVNGALLAGGKINVDAKNNAVANGEVNALGNVVLKARDGALEVIGPISVATGSLNAGAGTDAKFNGTISATGRIDLYTGRDLLSTAAIESRDVINASAGRILNASGRLNAQNAINVTGGDVSLSAAATNGNVTAQARGNLRLQGEIVVKGNAQLGAVGTFSNAAPVSAGVDLTVNAGTLINNASLSTMGASSVTASSLINRGTLYGFATTLEASQIDNAGGQVLAGDRLEVKRTTLTNNAGGLFAADGDLLFNFTGTLKNTGGRIAAGHDLTANAAGAFDLSATSAGTMKAGNLLAVNADVINNSGAWTPQSKGLSLTSFGDFSNAGLIEMAGDFRINTTGNIYNSGAIKTGGSIALSGTSVTNTNVLKADVDVALRGNVTNRGTVEAGRDVIVGGSAFDNGKGRVHADRDLNVDVSGAANNVGGVLEAASDVTIRATSLNNDREPPLSVTEHTATFNQSILDPIVVSLQEYVSSGCIPTCSGYYLPELTVASLNPDYLAGTVARSYRLFNPKRDVTETIALPQYETTRITQSHGAEGRITAGAHLDVSVKGTISNRGSTIEAGQSVSLNASGLRNGRSDSLVESYEEGINPVEAEQFITDLNRTQSLVADRTYVNLIPAATRVATEEKGFFGTIRSGGDIGLDFANLTNEGTVLAAGDLSIRTLGTFANVGESSYAVDTVVTRRGSDTAPLIVPVLDENGNVVSRDPFRGKSVVYFDQQLTSTQTPAVVAAGGKLSISAQAVTNANAQLLAQGDVSVSSFAQIENASGTIESRTGDVALSAAAIGNTRADTAWLVNWQLWFEGRRAKHDEEDFFEVIKQVETAPAGVISAGRDVVANTGALDNKGSLINAGRDLTVTATGAVDNEARQRAVKYVLSHYESDGREWDWADRKREIHATGIPENTPSTIQAGGNLNVTSGGILQNTGNILGEYVALSGSAITNGLTDYHSQTPLPTNPNRVISLGDVILGAGITNAQGHLAAATAVTINIAAPSAPETVANIVSVSSVAVDLGERRLHDQEFHTPGSLADLAKSEITKEVIGAVIAQERQSTTAATYSPAPPAAGVNATLEASSARTLNLRYMNSNAASAVLTPLGPDYLLSLLPQNLVTSNDLLFFADPYVEQQLLRQAALRETGGAYFVNGLAFDDQNNVSIDTQQQALLYQNAAAFAQASNLNLGVALTEEQQNTLDRPLLWYVEQKIKQKDGSETAALVPTVYLPKLFSESTQNLAGGLIQGQDVFLSTPGTLTNTGFIVAENLSITAAEFINQKRLADIGTRTDRPNSEGYFRITGEALQAGGFLSAANLTLNAERVQSISGEFQLLADTQEVSEQKTQELLAKLRSDLGGNFTESTVADHLHQEWVQTKDHEFEQIAMAVVSIAVTAMTGGMGATLLGTQTALGSTIANAAFSSMASSLVTGAISGDLSLENVLRAGVTAGLTAGLTGNLGLSKLPVDPSFGDHLINWGGRALVSAGVNTAINGGSFGNAFVSSFVNNAAASAATWIGDTFNISAEDANFGTSVAHAVSHAALGCAAAAAQGNDCASGATGAAVSAIASNFIAVPMVRDENGQLRPATLPAALITAAVTSAGALIAENAGLDAMIAFNAAANEFQNNRLLHPKEIELIKARARDFAERMRQEGYNLTEAEATKILAQRAADAIDQFDQIAPDGMDKFLNAQASIYLIEIGKQAGSFVDPRGYAIRYFTTRSADPSVNALLRDDFYNPSLYDDTYNNKVLQDFAYENLDKNLLGSNPTPEAVTTYLKREQDQNKRALIGTALLLGALAAPLLPEIAAMSATAARACAANAVLCFNRLGIAASEVAAGDALPMGVAVTAAAASGAKVATSIGDSANALTPVVVSLMKKELTPSSGVRVLVNSERTTTVLGSYASDMERIVTELNYPKTLDFDAKVGGFNVLNVPDEFYKSLSSLEFWEKYNKPFLDAAIKRGDDIVLATRPTANVLRRALPDGRVVKTGFGREYDHLLAAGYRYDEARSMMIRR